MEEFFLMVAAIATEGYNILISPITRINFKYLVIIYLSKKTNFKIVLTYKNKLISEVVY